MSYSKILVLFTFLMACYPSYAASTNSVAPNFVSRDINGSSYVLSDHRGEIIILNLWATWCGPCMLELPHLNMIDKKYEDKNVNVIAVSIDSARDASRVRSYVRSRGYVFTTLHDYTTSIVLQYRASKIIPFTVIIDRKGKIIYQKSGYAPGDEKIYIDIIESMI